MEFLKIIISYAPIAIVGIFYLFVNRKKIFINELLNLFIISFLTILLFVPLLFKITTILGAFLYALIRNIYPTFSLNEGFGLFFKAFFTAGLCEEFSKWLGIKILKPKNGRKIVLYSIFLSVFIASIENHSYFQNYGLLTGIYRLLMPMHIMFQIIMSFFLLKGFASKKENRRFSNFLFQTLAILIPAILHGIFDAIFWNSNAEETNIIIPLILGILTYGFTFWTIYKYRATSPLEEENEQKISIVKMAISVLLFLFFIYAFRGTNLNKLTETINISHIDTLTTII